MEKRVVLITGGTSGIGLAAARQFLDAGAGVMLLGRDAERGRQAIAALAAGDRCRFLAADVRRPVDCARAVAETVRSFGGLDVLVNSAGIYRELAADELTEAAYAAVMDTNVKGTMFMSRYALPALKKRSGSSIVNVASDAGLQGNYLCSLYCASKGAVTLFTKALALEAAPFGVRVNCVCPGDIATPLTEAQLTAALSYEAALREMRSVYPLGRIGTADEAAAVIVFLASPAASFVTGAAWSVDGGITA